LLFFYVFILSNFFLVTSFFLIIFYFVFVGKTRFISLKVTQMMKVTPFDQLL